jgi:hypothetical protein
MGEIIMRRPLRRSLITVIILAAAGSASAGAGPGSVHTHDARIMAEELSAYLGSEPVVSFTGPDSALVLFVALGGSWQGEEAQWEQLAILSSYAIYLDLRRDWELADIAVSFGDSWCRIPPDGLASMADPDAEGGTVLDQLRSVTEVRDLPREDQGN